MCGPYIPLLHPLPPPPGDLGWYAHYDKGAPTYHEIWLTQVWGVGLGPVWSYSLAPRGHAPAHDSGG